MCWGESAFQDCSFNTIPHCQGYRGEWRKFSWWGSWDANFFWKMLMHFLRSRRICIIPFSPHLIEEIDASWRTSTDLSVSMWYIYFQVLKYLLSTWGMVLREELARKLCFSPCFILFLYLFQISILKNEYSIVSWTHSEQESQWKGVVSSLSSKNMLKIIKNHSENWQQKT